MKRFWSPKPQPEQRIDALVDQASKGKMTRRRLVTSLTALGASSSAIATFVAAAEWLKNRDRATQIPGTQSDQQQVQQHDDHIAAQVKGANSTPNAAPTPQSMSNPQIDTHLNGIMQDYHPDAVVEDMLSHTPIEGHAAIRLHKAQEFLTFSNLHFAITRRYAVQDQVVAEWIATGILTGEFKGLVGEGDTFEIPGVTVVVRNAEGKIIKESIYYNLPHVQKFLRFKTVAE